MPPAVALFVSLTLFSTMLALGLSLRLEAVRSWCHRPALPLRVLLGSCLLVPLLALLVLQQPWTAALSPSARIAIALMALCPSAPLAMRKARKAGGDHQLAALVQVGAALAAVISVPLLALLFRRSFALAGWEIRGLDVALQVGQVQLLPLLLGLAIRRWRPAWAERLEAPLNRAANLLLLVLFSLVLLKAGPQLLVFARSNGLALLVMLLLAAAALLIGRLLALPDSSHGATTALVTAMRNPGLALLFASRHGQGLPGLKIGIVAYVLVTVLASLPLMQRQRLGRTA